MFELIVSILTAIVALSMALLPLAYAIINIKAMRDVREENIKEAMVVREGYDFCLDVAGAGLRELKITDLGKYEAKEVVKEGEMWSVYQSDNLDKAFEGKKHPFVYLAKDKNALLLRLGIKTILFLGATAAFIVAAIMMFVEAVEVV